MLLRFCVIIRCVTVFGNKWYSAKILFYIFKKGTNLAFTNE